MLFVYSAGLVLHHIPCNGRDPIHREALLLKMEAPTIYREETACSWGYTLLFHTVSFVFFNIFNLNLLILGSGGLVTGAAVCWTAWERGERWEDHSWAVASAIMIISGQIITTSLGIMVYFRGIIPFMALIQVSEI